MNQNSLIWNKERTHQSSYSHSSQRKLTTYYFPLILLDMNIECTFVQTNQQIARSVSHIARTVHWAHITCSTELWPGTWRNYVGIHKIRLKIMLDQRLNMALRVIYISQKEDDPEAIQKSCFFPRKTVWSKCSVRRDVRRSVRLFGIYSSILLPFNCCQLASLKIRQFVKRSVTKH